jgi:hypothetical protein
MLFHNHAQNVARSGIPRVMENADTAMTDNNRRTIQASDRRPVFLRGTLGTRLECHASVVPSPFSMLGTFGTHERGLKLVTRVYLDAELKEQDQIGILYKATAIFGRGCAAEPDVLIEPITGQHQVGIAADPGILGVHQGRGAEQFQETLKISMNVADCYYPVNVLESVWNRIGESLAECQSRRQQEGDAGGVARHS